MTSFKQFLEEELLDEEFALDYEKVSAEMDFALALALRRDELGLTQQELAALTGIKQPMIARIEHGQMPTAPTLQKLAKALKVAIMFTGDGLILLPFGGRAKRNAPEVEDSAEMYAEMEEIEYQYTQKMRGSAARFSGKSGDWKEAIDETVTFTS